jgi:SAM-dependent methyltransferase
VSTPQAGPGREAEEPASYVGPEEAGGNVYDKYAARNPISRRLMSGFMSDFDALVERSGAREAHEVGCGEGELSARLARGGLRARGTDAFPLVVDEAKRRAAAEGLAIGYEARAVQELSPGRDSAELIVCCEVLEHLEDPDGALEILAGLAKPWLIASVPREPLWRGLNLLRFTYVSMLGNTPGHVNHWSKRGFQDFLSGQFEVIELRSPLPWTMALCRAG